MTYWRSRRRIESVCIRYVARGLLARAELSPLRFQVMGWVGIRCCHVLRLVQPHFYLDMGLVSESWICTWMGWRMSAFEHQLRTAHLTAHFDRLFEGAIRDAQSSRGKAMTSLERQLILITAV